MSDRLLRESDVLRIAFQLPYVVNSAFFDAVKALPSADRPQGEVDAVEIYEKAESQLERNEITVGEFEKIVEPLRHLFYNRPQGKWKAKSFHEFICDNCGFSFDMMKCDFLENMKYCPNCGVRKGADNETA